MTIIIKTLKKSKNEELLKELKELVSKWRKILHHDGGNSNSKTTPSKKEVDELPEEYLIEGKPLRNRTRNKLYINLKPSLKIENEEEKETKKKELINNVIKIEEAIFEKYKGDSPYSNRVMEILHNIRENEEFRDNIVNGEIIPEELSSMDVIKMVSKEKQEKLDETKKNKVNSIQSDWILKHTKVTEGVYKCRKCGGNKTTQSEMQTRSADEPMTLFITCVDCGNGWKI